MDSNSNDDDRGLRPKTPPGRGKMSQGDKKGNIGRSCWGSVLIFQGPAKGLRKNQQTQLVRPVMCIGTYKGAGLEDRNVYRGSFTYREG